MKNIKIIEKKKKIVEGKKRVAAYARVSMNSDVLKNSFANQVNYYSNLIKNTPNFEYAGVYSDFAVSGTGTKKRDGFKELIKDAKDGKIDIILTKSISRFARNTVDLLNTVRELKTLGVEVRFEKERINSLTSDGELMISLLAAFAQSESENMSTNIKWAKKKSMEQGKDQYRPTFGYDYKDNNYIINVKEAEIVKYIFKEFINGKNYADIARELANNGIKTRKNNLFNYAQVKCILKNERYTGTVIMQKCYIKNPLTHERVVNKGEKQKYIVNDMCPTIISKDEYDKAQIIIKKLSDKYYKTKEKNYGNNEKSQNNTGKN